MTLPPTDSQVVVVAMASSVFAVIERTDWMMALWALYTVMLGLSLARDWKRRRCDDALEALTARAERAADAGKPVSWFADELLAIDPIKARRVQARRERRQTS